MRVVTALLILGAALLPAAAAGDGRRAFDCRPALPYFCGNIHVSCSGATTLPTRRFVLSVAGTSARVDFAGAPAPVRGTASGEHDLVVRLEGGRDWIRIHADGRYSHRVYRERGPVMSRGTCVATTGR